MSISIFLLPFTLSEHTLKASASKLQCWNQVFPCNPSTSEGRASATSTACDGSVEKPGIGRFGKQNTCRKEMMSGLL
jgi:hypothetical protein